MFPAFRVERCTQGPRACKEEVTLKNGGCGVRIYMGSGMKNKTSTALMSKTEAV